LCPFGSLPALEGKGQLNKEKLEVIGANTEYYRGKRAYFEGRHVKTGDLDKKQHAAVIHTATTGEMPENKEN
jgi:hypothetical protein